MSVHRPEGLSDVFMEPTEAPPAPPDPADRSGSSAGAAGPGDSSPACGSRCCCSCCWPSPPCPGPSGRSARRTPPRSPTYLTDHPTTGPWLDRLGFFDVYSSVWFSAIYLLLFVSLVGCILPRTKVHLAGVRGRPPRAPRRFDAVPGAGLRPGGRTAVAGRRRRRDRAARRLALAPVRPHLPRRHPRRGRRHASRCPRSAGTCARPATSSSTWRSSACSSPWPPARCCTTAGRRSSCRAAGSPTRRSTTTPSSRAPRSPRPASCRSRCALDEFESRFDPVTLAVPRLHGARHADRPRRGARSRRRSRSTTPSTRAAPRSTCRATGTRRTSPCATPPGEVAFSGPTPFLPQDEVYTSRGVVKVPDVSGDQEQIGLVGYLLPTVDVRETTFGPAYASVNPQPERPGARPGRLAGQPRARHRRPAERVRARRGAHDAAPGRRRQARHPRRQARRDRRRCPTAWARLTFEGLPRYVALDLRHDPALPFVLVFALLAFAGLATSLFAPRRRLWLRSSRRRDDGRTVVTAAGLARGDDVGLQPELDQGARGRRSPAPLTDPRSLHATPPQERPRHDHR